MRLGVEVGGLAASPASPVASLPTSPAPRWGFFCGGALCNDAAGLSANLQWMAAPNSAQPVGESDEAFLPRGYRLLTDSPSTHIAL